MLPRRRRISRVAIIAAAAAVAVAAVLIAALPFEATLEFQIRDRVSRGAVWNATVTIRDRFLRTYYAGGGESLLFSRLAPGKATLEVSAPNYQPVSVPVTLRRGRNRVAEPIDVTGLRIPGLARFIVSEDLSGATPQATIWPLSKEGPAVVNHPALDLWIGARVSTHLAGGQGQAAARGAPLFAGELDWSWDHSPDALARYRARLPLEAIAQAGAGRFVIDYLLIVPDPLAIERGEVAAIVAAAWTDSGASGDPASLRTYLAQYADRFDFYVHTSWNVSRP